MSFFFHLVFIYGDATHLNRFSCQFMFDTLCFTTLTFIITFRLVLKSYNMEMKRFVCVIMMSVKYMQWVLVRIPQF